MASRMSALSASWGSRSGEHDRHLSERLSTMAVCDGVMSGEEKPGAVSGATMRQPGQQEAWQLQAQAAAVPIRWQGHEHGSGEPWCGSNTSDETAKSVCVTDEWEAVKPM